MKLKNILIVVNDIEKSKVVIWKRFIGKDIITRNHASELYFEESDSWGQKVIRFYDPDGNLIEVGSPM